MRPRPASGGLSDLIYVLRADLYRYGGRGGRALLKALVTIPGYRYSCVMRACGHVTQRRGRVASVIALLVLNRYPVKYGIIIPCGTQIGPGLHIGHFGGIVVNDLARIGRNCNLSQGVTIGVANRGPRAGTATIGDGVYIGPGAKIVGAVTIGDNVAIGANSVVTRDVPAGAVVVGAPARVISMQGADDYVQRTDWDEALRRPVRS